MKLQSTVLAACALMVFPRLAARAADPREPARDEVSAQAADTPAIPAAGLDAQALIEHLRSASSAERPLWVHALSLAGPEAIDATRKARDAARDGELRRALALAAKWQLAHKISADLRKGFESDLTFAGQYLPLVRRDREITGALLALVEDAATDFQVRLAACRALADAIDPHLDRKLSAGRRTRLLSRLRELYHDVLLPALLREQAGILLAMLGDLQAVDSEILRLSRYAAGDDTNEILAAHLQLANLYYRIRDYSKAVQSYVKVLAIYERVVALQQRSGTSRESVNRLLRLLAVEYYNAACSCSLNRDVNKAKLFLRKAARIDPTHFRNMEKDGDLANLRQAPDYAVFREELGKQLGIPVEK